jgi:hypothetical protein
LASSPALAIILPSILQNSLNIIQWFVSYYYTIELIPGAKALDSIFFSILGLSILNCLDA